MNEANEQSVPVTLDGYTLAPTPVSVRNPQVAESWESRKRKLTSPVWDHFVKCTIDGIEYAFCEHCGAKYKAISKNGTRVLLKHMKKCFNKPLEEPQTSLNFTRKDEKRKDGFGDLSCDWEFEKAHKEEDNLHSFRFNQEVSQQTLANAIVVDQYPLSMVEFVGFQNFCASLQPCFKMPSRDEIKRDIRSIHNVKKANVYEVLEKVQSRIAITSDIWTSDQRKDYLSISAHYLDESWILRKCDLRFIYVPVPCTTETLWNHLTASLSEFNVGEKISTITMANCSHSGMKDLDLKMIEGELLLDGKFVHMQCGAHIISLLAQDCLSLVEKVTEKIRETVGFWTASPSREEVFAEVASQLRIPHIKKKLCIDDTTQWHSTYSMLEASITYKEMFTRLKDINSLYTIVPSEEEWDLVSDICKKLKLLYGFAELYRGPKHVTSNNYFPMMCFVREGIAKWVTSSNETISRMAWNMFRKLEEYWNSVHIVLAIAAVLDPRYKLCLVEYFFMIIYGTKSSPEVERVRKACYQLFHKYRLRFRMNSEPVFPSHCEETDGSFQGSGDSLDGYDQFIKSETYDKRPRWSELSQYLAEPLLPRTRDFDVLGWWMENGDKYPILQLIARDFLAIPISCTTSDPAFSALGRVLPKQYRKLKPDMLETLMCTNNWLRNEMEGDSLNADSGSVCSTRDGDDSDWETQGA
ncbi:hypothetical protein CDL15_Pgr021518 [Punica granatum]|uniref:Zinc finger BED domain-containing protein RICESLEEPER 2-like n=1 Tax=Punica granatum TaxID=22663 RepID=A0A218XPK8_PUNGR|nr:hypothetical protein CDL15_Pgr021518 [Punica granatum]